MFGCSNCARISISHGLEFGYDVEEAFAVLFVFVWKADLMVAVLGESFVNFVANGSVLCYSCGITFVGFVVYLCYTGEHVGEVFNV